MKTSSIIFLSLAAVLTAAIEFARRKRLRPFLTRSCSGRAWREAFPNASKEEIRRFLSLFCDAFLFKKSRSLRFRPEDRIMDVYRAIYPSDMMADALEWEHLRRGLEREYHRDFSVHLTPELTLGELFTKVKNAYL